LKECELLGGGARPQLELIALAARGRVVPVCPEVAGGLPVPRPPAEIVGGDGDDVLDGRARVVTVAGEDVTAAYLRGAECALAVVQRYSITTAILKQHSPSCGSTGIYDGTHSGRLRAGQGVTAALLRRHGVTIWSEEDLGSSTALQHAERETQSVITIGVKIALSRSKPLSRGRLRRDLPREPAPGTGARSSGGPTCHFCRNAQLRLKGKKSHHASCSGIFERDDVIEEIGTVGIIGPQ